MNPRKRIAIFASGSGSNFEALVCACERGEIKADVVAMVCDHADAYVVERAKNHGVDSFVFSPKSYASKAEMETAIADYLDQKQVDLVCLAGYMRIVADTLLSRYGGRIINIHPALLPSFKGAHAVKDALEFGVKVFGVTVHYVDSTIDGGKIIDQQALHYDGSDLDELMTQIHAIEHQLYPAVVERLLNP